MNLSANSVSAGLTFRPFKRKHVETNTPCYVGAAWDLRSDESLLAGDAGRLDRPGNLLLVLQTASTQNNNVDRTGPALTPL